MGGDTSIRNQWLNTKERCADAFWEENKKEKKDMSNGVVLIDLLTMLHRLTSSEFTGVQLCAWLASTVNSYFKQGCEVVVVLLDDATRTPTQKKGEQKKRDIRSGEEPYEICLRFTDQGMIVDDNAPAVPFVVSRVLANRSIRHLLFDYLIRGFTRHYRFKRPLTQMVVFDYHAEGAVVHREGRWGMDTSTAHQWGEADIGIVYWINRLWDAPEKNYKFFIQSIDSDLIPITLHLLDTKEKQGTREGRTVEILYWRTRWMDCQRVWKYITKELKWSVKAWISLFCICGTDFTDPKLCWTDSDTPSKLLFKGIRGNRCFSACESFSVHKHLERSSESFSCLVRVIRSVYSYAITDESNRQPRSCLGFNRDQRLDLKHSLLRLNKNRKRLAVRARSSVEVEDGPHSLVPFKLSYMRQLSKVNPSAVIPSTRTLRQIHNQLKWNIGYWLVDWERERGKISLDLLVPLPAVRMKHCGVGSNFPNFNESS